MALFPTREPTGVWWRDHSLSLVLVALMTAQTVWAVHSGAYVFAHEQPFGQAVKPWSAGFWMWWSWEYNISLLADTFGVLLIVVLSKWLRERGSAEDKGSE